MGLESEAKLRNIKDVILLETWKKNQWIEYVKIHTLIQGLTNSEKAQEALDSLGSNMMPDFGEIKKKQAKDMLKSYKQFRDKTIRITGAGKPIVGDSNSDSIFRRK